MDKFVRGLFVGAFVAVFAVLFVVFERDRLDAENTLEGKALMAKFELEQTQGKVRDLANRVEQLEEKHACTCGEECRCEECDCQVLEKCECGDPKCDWPLKHPFSRPSCPKWPPPPRAERPKCQGPCCPAPHLPAPLPRPAFDADDSDNDGVPEV